MNSLEGLMHKFGLRRGRKNAILDIECVIIKSSIKGLISAVKFRPLDKSSFGVLIKVTREPN